MSPIPATWPRDMKPLCWMGNGDLLGYQGDFIVRCGKAGGFTRTARLPLPGIKRFLGHVRLASRILRVEPRVALEISPDCILLAWQRAVFAIDLSANSIIKVQEARAGFSDPLAISNGNGYVLAVWGDYGANNDAESVNIYGLNSMREVVILHTFPAGTVRHVHNVVRRQRGGYYIFTGDMETASGIYLAREDFATVEPIATGDQRFRAVRGFDTSAGLIYATDSATTENHVFLLDEDASCSPVDIGAINGPCIYGGECSSGYLFTTTVEPDESLSGIRSLLSRRLGPGVKTRESQVLLAKSDAGLVEISRFEGDALPMKLFQYGSLQIPMGTAPEGQVVAFARSLRKCDGRVVEIGSGKL